MTATVAEVAAPEPAAPEPTVLLGVLLPAVAEDKARRIVRAAQCDLGALIASWLAAGEEGAPVPAGSSAGLSVQVPASVAASVHAEAERRGLAPELVAAARLASIGGR